ncbi:MAG TPA: hypothetical protein VMF30_15670 [Pirellulales bacterium]|nr:hypothetical protein [Pirellulales bacterium]
MRSFFTCFMALSIVIVAERAWGHGFDLSINYDTNGNPASFTAASAQPVLDQDGATPGPANLFLDAFAQTPNADGSLGTYEGFAQTAGPWPLYTATFNILSPLYYSDGTGGPAVPASAGTDLHIYDRYAGNPDPVTDPHPGASYGDVYVNGTTPFYQGFGVSLYDFHELEKDLYIAPDSTQTYGEYGFAFEVIVSFVDGPTLSTGPLVDIFATDTTTDPDNPGGFATFAPDSQQDAATLAVYDAVMAAAPEPSSFLMAAFGAIGMGIYGYRRTVRRSRV